jgi:hypothetical protein
VVQVHGPKKRAERFKARTGLLRAKREWRAERKGVWLQRHRKAGVVARKSWFGAKRGAQFTVAFVAAIVGGFFSLKWADFDRWGAGGKKALAWSKGWRKKPAPAVVAPQQPLRKAPVRKAPARQNTKHNTWKAA